MRAMRLAILPLLGLLALALLAEPALAQQASPLGISPDSSEPIEIEADTLLLDQNANTATFVGNVVVVQGGTRMKSDRLVVHYRNEGETQGEQIRQIDATGNVVITTEDDQSATGQWARYVSGTQMVTMGDDVLLQQGDNVLKGRKLEVDLATNKSQLFGAPGGNSGRVQGLFNPKQTEPPTQ